MEIFLAFIYVGTGFTFGVAFMALLYISRDKKEEDWYEEHMEGDVHHVEVTKIPKTMFGGEG